MTDDLQEFAVDDAAEGDATPEGAGSANKKKHRIHLVAWEDIKLGTEPRYLIKGLIPRVGLTVVWGRYKTGKSFWTFDAVMHVALARRYRGRRVHGGSVVYCAFEGQSGVAGRKAAFEHRFLQDHNGQVPFYLQPLTLDLVRDQKELVAAIKDKLCGEAPAAIVLDTLNRSLRGSESKDEDMAGYISAVDAIREAFDCAVIVVHHCGVDGSRPRGHTSLTGAADVQLAVERDTADNVIVTVEFAKDGPQGDSIASRLEVVEVGTDDDGDPITSCVVVPVEQDKVVLPQQRRGKKEADGPRKFREAFLEALVTAGLMVPVRGDGPLVKAVDVEIVRQQFYSRWATGQPDKHKRDGARRTAFGRELHPRAPRKSPYTIWVSGEVEWIALNEVKRL